MSPRISSLRRVVAGSAPLLALLAACGGAGGGPPSARLDEVRIAARQTESGFGFERERARALFFEALGSAEEGDCRDAAHVFDRLVERFPGSRFMPPALYDAAVCYARVGDDSKAAQRLERLVRQVPESPGTTRARLELAAVYARLRRWDRAERHLAAVLARDDLRPSVRLEALVERSRLFLSMGRLGTSERLAREALAYEPALPPGADASRDAERAAMHSLRAEATFVQAETYRMRASAVPLAREGERPRRERISQRGRLMLEAQRLYFETLRRGDARWSEQAGLRLGILYRDLWNELPAPIGVPAAVAEAASVAPAATPPAALTSEVEALVQRGLRQAEVALRQIERLEAVPTGFAERVRAEIRGATGPLGAAALGTRPSQDL